MTRPGSSDKDGTLRYCPSCAASQRTKIIEHFRAHPLFEREPMGLRVSRYLLGTRHVRLSIWGPDRVLAVLALEEREARRLATFLTDTGDRPPALTRLERARQCIDTLARRQRSTRSRKRPL